MSGISSKSIYASKALNDDIALYYNGLISGNIPTLGPNDRAQRISPVPQLIRRLLTKRDNFDALEGISEKEILATIDKYLQQKVGLENVNMDRVYDNITADELDKLYRELEQERGMATKKNGFEDCIDDEKATLSNINQVTQDIRESITVEKTNEEQR